MLIGTAVRIGTIIGDYNGTLGVVQMMPISTVAVVRTVSLNNLKGVATTTTSLSQTIGSTTDVQASMITS
jgi:hypothetical protein